MTSRTSAASTATGPLRAGPAASAGQPTRSASPPGTARRLVVQDLSVRFRLPGSVVAAVSEVSFELPAGQCLALVGESGCGKSVMVSALLGLLPGNADTAGTAHLHSDHGGGDAPVELLGAPERVLARQVRGRQVGLVPQSPAAHLTPVRTAGAQLREALRALRPEATDVAALAVETAARVGLPAQALELYPHELSGGMAQRVATALALAGDAWLLLADEPTTGLDRPLVDRTLDELGTLVDGGRAVLLITHDLTAAARIADVVAVMYAGRLVELGPTDQVLDAPRHPYTAGLVGALPDRGFQPIRGMPPELTDLPAGCAFAPRCPRADSACEQRPELLADPTRPDGARTVASAFQATGTVGQRATGARLTACRHPC